MPLPFVKEGLELGQKGVAHKSREGFVGTSLAAEPLLALAVTVTSEQHVDSSQREPCNSTFIPTGNRAF